MTWLWNPFAVPALGCAAVSTALSILVASKRTTGPTYAPVILMVAIWTAGIAALSCLVDPVAGLPVARLSMSAILGAGVFATRYVGDFVRLRHRRRWVAGSFVVTAAGIALVWFDPGLVTGMRHPPWGGVYPLLGERGWVYFALAMLGVGVPGVMALRMWRQSPPSRRRRQAAYICVGYLVSLGGGLDIIGARGGDLPPLAWVFGTISVFVFYQAMVRWRLHDSRTAVHRSLLWLIVVGASFGPIYALTEVTAGWAAWRSPWPRALLVGLAVAALVLWIARVEPLALRVLRRRSRRYGLIVEALAARAAGVRRPEEIVPLVDQALQAVAGLRISAVHLAVDVGDQRLEVHLPAGAPALGASPESVAPDEPLGRGDLDDDPRGADSPSARLLAATGGDAVLPLRHAGVNLGVLVARGGPPGASLDEITREGLARLAATAAVAFTNAALEQALERRSALLEQEVEERTAALAHTVDDLKGAQAQLVHAERQSSLGLLVAGVSHEINNAINFIAGNLPMLEQYADAYAELYARAGGAGARPRADVVRRAEEARAELPGAIAGVGQAAERARGIVADLRRLARRDDKPEPVDVRELLDSTLRLLGAELGERVTVERRFADTLPRVTVRSSALSHVFLNVLLNAVQAQEDVAGRLLVTAAASDGGVRVTIADAGPGVPQADRERLFAPFVSTRPKAAGLGLAVCRQILDQHGGRIRLGPSAELGGAEVTIELPASAV